MVLAFTNRTEADEWSQKPSLQELTISRCPARTNNNISGRYYLFHFLDNGETHRCKDIGVSGCNDNKPAVKELVGYSVPVCLKD